MNNRILICTDLDRTLLPNGEQAESPGVRAIFSRLAQQPNVDLAYVTGRHRELVLDAIKQYEIPVPNFVLGDVGSSIYECRNSKWVLWQAWQDEIAPEWASYRHDDLMGMLDCFDELNLQESEKQNTFKLSYYTDKNVNLASLKPAIQRILKQYDIRASLIWSIDEIKQIGLLDVLPQNATKLHAIEFLMQNNGYTRDNTVFAGDSGNDLPVLASHLNSVLVANSSDEVRVQATEMAAANNTKDALYLAKGGFLNTNGNYAAGILEGVNHYLPGMVDWRQLNLE